MEPIMYSKSVLGKRSGTPKNRTPKRIRVMPSTGRLQQALKREIWQQREPKYTVVAISQTVDTAGPIVVYLSGTADGVNESERLGQMIRSEFLDIRVTCRFGAAAADLPNFVRFVIFQANDIRGVLPTAALVFGSATPTVTDHRNTDAEARKAYTILVDETICGSELLANSASVANTAKGYVAGRKDIAYLHWHIKKHKKELRYVGATAAITDAGQNAVCMLIITDAASGEDVTVAGEVLHKFKG